MSERPFRVVTHRNWLAEFFAPVGGKQDFGMDIDPASANDMLWWAPGHWVARAAAAGVHLPLLSAGPRWLARYPKLPQRPVAVLPARHVPRLITVSGQEGLHTKLPEVKDERFPAAVRTCEEMRTALDEGHVHTDELVQVSPETEFDDREARLFLAHGKVTAATWYRYGGVWHDAPEWETGQNTDTLAAMSRDVEELLRDVDCPPGFVVDATTVHGRTVVIEANAAWSSNPYDADPHGVYAAVIAAHDFTGEHRQWWFGTAQYGKVPPLRLSTSR